MRVLMAMAVILMLTASNHAQAASAQSQFAQAGPGHPSTTQAPARRQAQRQPSPPKAASWLVKIVPNQLEQNDVDQLNEWLQACKPNSSQDVMGLLSQRVAAEGAGASYTTTLFCKPGNGEMKDVRFVRHVWEGPEAFQKLLEANPIFAVVGSIAGTKDTVLALEGRSPPKTRRPRR